ncbi:hypothetical protein Micbo1qcDRAFT_154597 [Microdochium bolleyi]|uniref:LysM domain-containing protein n=1 Tax=Microdochium bolleyi TaxID=196109 RepID=A0A136IIT4_9PEZI|nr:hypothetical protein Micbo1qcDRAFT_154597 [Microdochium bolleyi]
MRWNPSITAGCGNLQLNRSYCVEAVGEPALPSMTKPPATTITTPPSTQQPPPTETESPPSSSIGPNGVATPLPIREGMTWNCRRFYKAQKGDSCEAIIAAAGIYFPYFYMWNPTVGEDCSGLWSDTFFCIQNIEGPPITPTRPPTTTIAQLTPTGNGVTTPLPIQTGMTTNCQRFYKVQKGDTCDAIITAAGISGASFYAWNAAVKNDCSGLWSDTYCCIGTNAGPSITLKPPTPTTTTTTTTKPAGNGVATPTPIQTGMVTNCRIFHFVKSGETCATIASARAITVQNFVRWNPAIGPSCTRMWANTWACVGLL